MRGKSPSSFPGFSYDSKVAATQSAPFEILDTPSPNKMWFRKTENLDLKD